MNRHASVTDESQPLNRNDLRRQRTRQQLIGSTSVLLIELGYDALTIQDITDDADVARATFYIHFQDKEEVVWAILEEHFGQLKQLLSALNEPDPDRWRYLKFLGLFKYIEENKQLMSTLMSEKGHIKLLQQTSRFMAESLQQDLDSGKMERASSGSTAFEANFYAGAILNVMTWWLNQSPETTPYELADMVYESILRRPPPIFE